MAFPALALAVADVVVWLDDQTPKDEDVTAGWTALVVFLLLGAAVALLGFSLTKQLRKAQAAEDAGVYGHDEAPDEPDQRAEPSGPSPDSGSEPENHSAS
jgi:hypothetical protein